MCGKAGKITLFALFAQFSVVLTRACPPVALRLRKPWDPPKFLPPKTGFTLARNRISEDENSIKGGRKWHQMNANGMQIGGMVGFK